ncbi:unnamed protein product [Arctogadus glacialis]
MQGNIHTHTHTFTHTHTHTPWIKLLQVCTTANPNPTPPPSRLRSWPAINLNLPTLFRCSSLSHDHCDYKPCCNDQGGLHQRDSICSVLFHCVPHKGFTFPGIQHTRCAAQLRSDWLFRFFLGEYGRGALGLGVSREANASKLFVNRSVICLIWFDARKVLFMFVKSIKKKRRRKSTTRLSQI